MEVILLKDTVFGDKGAIVDVSAGYARNYLIPNKIALKKTEGSLNHVNEVASHQKKKLEKERAGVEATAQKLNSSKPLVIKAKGGENGVLFGAITNTQIAEVINAELGLSIDKRRVMVRNIKEVGTVDVPVKLTFGISAAVKVQVELEVEKVAEEKKTATKKKKTTKKKTSEEEVSEEVVTEKAEA